ncbi:MAG TPA: DUF5988 family protein [Micromonospora sp.]
MTEPVDAPAVEMTDIVLEGGPPDLPPALRTARVPVAQDKVKIEFRGGYEHFERTSALTPHRQVIFRWVTRTRIAE